MVCTDRIGPSSLGNRYCRYDLGVQAHSQKILKMDICLRVGYYIMGHFVTDKPKIYYPPYGSTWLMFSHIKKIKNKNKKIKKLQVPAPVARVQGISVRLSKPRMT